MRCRSVALREASPFLDTARGLLLGDMSPAAQFPSRPEVLGLHAQAIARFVAMADAEQSVTSGGPPVGVTAKARCRPPEPDPGWGHRSRSGGTDPTSAW